MNKLVIAIDGYSSCGKSTFAKRIARAINYLHIDSGAMYRAFTLYCLRKGIVKDSGINVPGLEKALTKVKINFSLDPMNRESIVFLDDENVEKEIRSTKVADKVSPVSAIKSVREKMVALQREMAKEKGIVMDGRDIGTVVFPNADIKIFMTADPVIRAERRLKELQAEGHGISFEEVKKNIMHRDHMDENREISPLKKADDALVMDNSFMAVDDQMAWFIDLYHKKTNAIN